MADTHTDAEPGEPLFASPTTPLGPYQIERMIGRGGMGVVYAAIRQDIGKRVAVKMMDRVKSPVEHARFLREARACALVTHPGLVQLFDCQMTPEGAPYLIMELLEGQTLRTYLKEQPPLTLAAAVCIARQVADALCAVHAQGIVHRDIKPENLMLVSAPGGGAEPVVKVLDFGIAKFLHNSPETYQSTGDNRLVGTIAYMSPEQCLSEAVVDVRSDVYSLGVILYEMLCGRPPFLAESGRLLYLHIYQQPSSPLEYRADLPPGLCTLVLRMLAKIPGRRPSMDEVYAELRDPGLLTQRKRRWLWLLEGFYRRHVKPVVRRAHRYAARHRLLTLLSLLIASYVFYCSPLSPPYSPSSIDPDEVHFPSVVRPGAVFFHRDNLLEDSYVQTHLDLNVGRNGQIYRDVYTYSTFMIGAHVLYCYALYDKDEKLLFVGGVPRCGVGRSRWFLGDYGMFHPRHCANDPIFIDPALAQRVARARLHAFNRDEAWFDEYCRKEEARKRIEEVSLLVPATGP